MVITESIMASFNRAMNYEPAMDRNEFTINAAVAFKLESLNPKKGTKAYQEMTLRYAIVEEYIQRTGDDTCEASEEFIEYLKNLDARELVPQ